MWLSLRSHLDQGLQSPLIIQSDLQSSSYSPLKKKTVFQLAQVDVPTRRVSVFQPGRVGFPTWCFSCFFKSLGVG